MPIKRVEFPDGSIKRVEVPEGATNEQILAFVQSQYQAPQADFSGVTSGVTSTYDQPKPQRTLPEIATRAAGLTGRSMAQGVGGLVDFAAEGARMNPLLLPGRAILAATGQDFPELNARGAIEQGLTQAGVPQPETAPERVISGVGEALTGAGLTAGLGGLPRAGLQLASAGTGATAGELTREAGGSPRLQTLAALGGSLIPGLGAGRGARMPATPEARELVTQAAARGIPIRPAGVGQGKVGQTLRGVPGAGAGKRYEADVLKANAALAETIGAPRGTPPAKVYPEAFRRNSAEYDRFAKTYPLTIDEATFTKLAEYRNSASRLGGAESPAVRAIDEFFSEAQAVGVPAPSARKALPESNSLVTPNTPTAAEMKRLSRVEVVPLSKARSIQRDMRFGQFDEGKHPGALIEGYGDIPVAVRRRDGEYLIFDGNHRSAQAIKEGKGSLRMHVINAADYDPEAAGRLAAPIRGSDEDLLAALGVSVPEAPPKAAVASSGFQVPGDLFKRLDTELGQVPYDPVSSRALITLQKQLRQQYKATMPEAEAARWDDLMRRYGDMKTVEPLYAKLAQTGGRIDPRMILARVNATKAGRSRMARGERGELGELANIGQAIQPPQPISPAAVGLGGAGLGAGALVSAPGSAGLYGLLNLAGRAADRAYLPQGNRLQTLGQGIPGIVPALAPFRFDQPQEQ